MTDLSHVVALVQKRAVEAATRTDMDARAKLLPVATAPVLDAAEHALGFPLPAALRALYAQVGNGGFGPGFGILGVAGGHTDDLGDNIITAYKAFAQRDPCEPNWLWPERLVRLCHWGCAIYSCVDCSSPESPVIVWVPNCWSKELTPAETAMAQESPSLDAWISDWATGVRLWDRITDLTKDLYPE
jgi:hypothetical protein